MLRRALAAADVLGLTTALFIAEWVTSLYGGAGTLSQTTEIAGFLISLPVWIIVAKAYGLYDQDEERTDHSAPDEFSGIFHMVTVCTAGAAALSLRDRSHPSDDAEARHLLGGRDRVRRLGESGGTSDHSKKPPGISRTL